MKTMLNVPTVQTKTPIARQKPIVYALGSRVAMWQEEINFYDRLLNAWLFSCKEGNRAEIEALIVQLNDLRESSLSEIRKKVDVIQGQSGHSNKEPADLHYTLYSFDQNLNHLKSKIFQVVIRFSPVQIW